MDAKAEPVGQKSVSLYHRILSEIRGRILSGEWQPGYHIPSENELAGEYGCSRMTANKAMSELAKLGLVERRRRSGSIVSRPRSQAAVLEIHDIRTEVQALGLPYRYELVSRRTAQSTGGDDFPEGVRLLHLTARHFAGKQPFCIEERTISLAAVPEAQDEAFDQAAPGPWLIARIPWSAAEHTIRAVAAGEEVAAALGLARHAACLVVERRTWSAEQPVTRVRLTYAGETHSLVARFAPRRS